ncbi:hypothetical protein NC652_018491 [Populus alba x Populus x berolinensis]|nr:hypothetical protein NC652_018491 [Populus alba x Populus x berolinensis]
MLAHLTNNPTASIIKPKIVNSAHNIDTSPSTSLLPIFHLPYIDHSTLLHHHLPPAILNPSVNRPNPQARVI